ncbi:MAG: PDZ domain-containing protein, partial [bacterium]|nr:PDZ domain-containing protein [bacterium]
MKIIEIEPNSLAAAAGIKPGDDIRKINGHVIRDAIDYRFYSSDEFLEIEFYRFGIPHTVQIEKEFDEAPGIIFKDIRYKCCGNKCIFCFIDQNPPGMRPALYLKDEDYRLSFIYGNYVTLTSISRRALQRIVEQRLSPLYISVHSTDPEIRKQMLGIKKD